MQKDNKNWKTRRRTPDEKPELFSKNMRIVIAILQAIAMFMLIRALGAFYGFPH